MAASDTAPKYFLDDRGRPVHRAWVMRLLKVALGVLLVPLCVLLVMEVLGIDLPPSPYRVDVWLLGALAVIASAVGLLALVFLLMQRAERYLESAVDLWATDDLVGTRSAAQMGLRYAFRDDLRTLGWFTLGLAAEGVGDFDAALLLFKKARGPLPIAASASDRRNVETRCEAHEKFARLALGEAVPALESVPDAPAPVHDDDSFGVSSIGANLDRLSNGRPVRDFRRLVSALALRRDGFHERALHELDSVAPDGREHLHPRERVLVEMLRSDLRARRDAPFRAAAAPDGPHARWAERVLDPRS